MSEQQTSPKRSKLFYGGIAVFALVLVGAGAGAGIALSQSEEEDSAAAVISFEEGSFLNLLALCQGLESESENLGEVTGITTCFGRTAFSCSANSEARDISLASGNACFDIQTEDFGTCDCDQGSLNILTESESPCTIGDEVAACTLFEEPEDLEITFEEAISANIEEISAISEDLVISLVTSCEAISGVEDLDFTACLTDDIEFGCIEGTFVLTQCSRAVENGSCASTVGEVFSAPDFVDSRCVSTEV